MINVEAWRPADGLVLEPNAMRAAKEQEQCLALTAGPGAGKTEMLAQRADFLLKTGVCRYPKRILAISFKVDASRNLKERVFRRSGSDLASRFDSYTFHAFAKRIIDRFRPVLTGVNALDVDYKIVGKKVGVSRTEIEFLDLVPLAIKILKASKMAKNSIRQTYSDVFLDEFQDCTNLQYELVKLAFLGTAIRLTAVGDTKQKIMGWAGALDGIFETFSKDFSAIPLNMYRNFRSKPRLLRMQNEIIRALDPESVMPDEQVSGEDGELLSWSFGDGRDEAMFLADVIRRWVNEDQLPPSEIAVLVSKQASLYTENLMNELENRGIPFRDEQQMQDISVEPATRVIVDYLICLYGEREPKAWIRLMNILTPYADEEIQSGARKSFNQLIKKQRKSVFLASMIDGPYAGWWDFVKDFLKYAGLETLVALSPDYESKSRLKEVIKDTRVRILELLKVESNLLKALARFSDDEAVRILTIHKSKGLEFHSVIMLGVEAQAFWGRPDEERCAFFVGVSRAKQRLVLTFTGYRETPPSNPYRWIENRTQHEEFIGYSLPFLTGSTGW